MFLLSWAVTPAWNPASTSYLGIKAVLLVAVVFGLVCVSRLKGARNLVMRRILAVLFAVGAALAIIFSNLISAVTRFLGVSHGMDLLLYFPVVVVVATWLMQRRHNIAVQAQITELTRSLALVNPEYPMASRESGPNHRDPLPPNGPSPSGTGGVDSRVAGRKFTRRLLQPQNGEAQSQAQLYQRQEWPPIDLRIEVS